MRAHCSSQRPPTAATSRATHDTKPRRLQHTPRCVDLVLCDSGPVSTGTTRSKCQLADLLGAAVAPRAEGRGGACIRDHSVEWIPPPQAKTSRSSGASVASQATLAFVAGATGQTRQNRTVPGVAETAISARQEERPAASPLERGQACSSLDKTERRRSVSETGAEGGQGAHCIVCQP